MWSHAMAGLRLRGLGLSVATRRAGHLNCDVNMKLKLCLLLVCPPLLAQEFACQLGGKIVPVAEYRQPTPVFTRLKNDGHPMTAFGFSIAHSQVLGADKATRDYCQSLIATTRTVLLSGQYPADHFHPGQTLSLKHVHRDRHVWPYWPDYYWLADSPQGR